MTTISQAFRLLVLTALAFALLGATSDQPITPENAVIIYNPGNGDFAGFRIVVDPSGDAWASDATGNTASRLPVALTQELFADIAAIPAAQQPARACSAGAPGMAVTSIWLYGLHRDADARQAPSADCAHDSRIAKLSADVMRIQRALYVNSYRARLVDGSTPDLAGASAAGSVQGSIADSVPVYREGSTYFTASSAGRSNATSYWTPSAGSQRNTTSVERYGATYISGFAPYTSYGLTGLSAGYGGAPNVSAPAGAIGGAFGNVSFGNVNQFQNSAFGSNGFNGTFRMSMGFNQSGTLTASGFSSSALRSGFSLSNSFGGGSLANGTLNGTVGSGALGY